MMPGPVSVTTVSVRARVATTSRPRGQMASKVSRWVIGDLSYVLAAGAMLVLLPPGRPLQVSVSVAAVCAFMLASMVALRLTVGVATGLQPVFVLVLFALPLNLVPLVMPLVIVTGSISRGFSPTRMLLSLGDSWFCVAPILVLALWAPGHASWSHWPIYVGAFGAQFVSDIAISAGRRALESRSAIPDRGTVLFPVAVDILLTPVGLAAAISAPEDPAAALAVVLGVLGLVALLARERGDRLKQEHLALHDPLTDLANRALFDELLKATARRCTRARTSGGLLVLDLTRFKDINDRYGHACGDRVLRAFAARLRGCVRDADTVARIGGDEFAVLLDEPVTSADAHSAANKLRRILALPFEIEGMGKTVIDAAIGAATFGAETTPTLALAEADSAMYDEKRAKPVASGRFR